MCFLLRFVVLVLYVYVLTLHYFMLQIDHHFITFLVTDMTIEELQKVATTHVDASFKARWLRWWNSSAKVKTKNKFPLLFLSMRNSLTIGLTKLLSGHMIFFKFFVCLFVSFFLSLTFRTIGISKHNWIRGLKLRLYPLRTSVPSTLTGF